jgi:hypothetical protein
MIQLINGEEIIQQEQYRRLLEQSQMVSGELRARISLESIRKHIPMKNLLMNY